MSTAEIPKKASDVDSQQTTQGEVMRMKRRLPHGREDKYNKTSRREQLCHMETEPYYGRKIQHGRTYNSRITH